MDDHQRPGPTVTLEDARAQLLSSLRPLPPHAVALDEALGRVLGEPVVAPEDVPRFANAAMDGYALRAEDTDRVPARLRLVGAITAGTVADVVLQKGQAIAITTGAPVPEGADAVCMMEHTRLEGGNVTIGEPVAPGENVRWPGEDIPRGSAVFEAGTVLTPAHLGVLASLGFTQVTTFPRPRVGVLSTGSELLDGTGLLQPGKIRDSNRHSLLALTRSAGCESIDLGLVADDEATITRALEQGAARCDAIVTSGGVSVGVADHMKTLLGRLGGGSLRWMEILIRPAKPFGFATLTGSGVPVLCLPGNPVAAMVSFELLARSAFRLMGGHALLERPALLALTDEPMSRRRDGTLHLVRVVARVDNDGRLHVRPIGGEGSHLLRAMALANALALVPDGEGVAAEQPVRVILLDAEELEAEKVPT